MNLGGRGRRDRWQARDCCRSVTALTVYGAVEHFAALVAGEISEEYVDLSVDLAGETSAGVLGKEDFRVPPKRARNGEGFDCGHIQHGAAEVAGVEVFHECVLVQRGAAAHVTNDGVRLKAGEARVVEEANRRRSMRQRVDEEIGGAEGKVQIGGRGQGSGAGGAGEELNLGVKRAEQAGDPLGNATGTKQENALAIERANAGLDLRLDPSRLRLGEEKSRELSVQTEDTGERGLGHGVIEESGEVRELSWSGAWRIIDPEVGVDTGGLQLHPAQIGRSGEPGGRDVAEHNVRGGERNAFFGLGEIGPKRDVVRGECGEQTLALGGA